MSLIAPLFLALGEFLTSGRPAKTVAQQVGVKLPDLSGALPKIQEHSWAGKLSLALADPHSRTELIPLFVHLARLERHYADLVAQYDRAQNLAEEIRSQKEVINLQDFIRAEAFTFKVHQAIGRVLRDLQKAESRLDKAQLATTEPPTTENPNRELSANTLAIQEVPVSAQAVVPPSSTPPSATSDASPEPNNAERSNAERSNVEHSAAIPSADEVQKILVRHRDRIKNTPAKDRQALIARILETERAKAAAQHLQQIA